MEMHFREFFMGEIPPVYNYSDMEVANIYFHNPKMTVREISKQTSRSIGEVYRILKHFGSPNRNRIGVRQHVVSLADSGISVRSIADMTGYTPRHVRNILRERR